MGKRGHSEGVLRRDAGGFVGKRDIAVLAARERARIREHDIRARSAPEMDALPCGEAAAELARFGDAVRQAPNMGGYFDPQHFVNMRSHLDEARHGFATLPGGGILEIVEIPCLPEDVMGFQIFTVYDPVDDADRGRVIGYAVYSIERGRASFGRAEAVRVAFDIFPEFREGRYRKVPFTNHEIYNIARRLLCRFRPGRFLVDAKTQIRQTRTGDPRKRLIYYIKRGYYPPDRKGCADVCLVRLASNKSPRQGTLDRLMRVSDAPFWEFPMESAGPEACGTPEGG